MQTKCVKIHHDYVILTSVLRSIFADIWFEHILLHDLSAKGLGTSSENLERLLLADNPPWRIYRALKMHLIVSTYLFVFILAPLYDLE